MNLGVFALKNLGRHPTRTLFNALSIGTITAIMMLWGCLDAGLFNLLEQTVTSFEIGEFQLHAPGYLANPDLYTTLAHATAWQEALTSQGFASSPRLYGAALAATGSLSAGVQIHGVDPQQEAQVTRIETYVDSGSWLTPAQPRGVVLGKLLAHHLQLAAGQEFILLAQAADGASASAKFTVAGILRPINSDIDDRAAYMQEASFRNFFAFKSGIHELAIARTDQGDAFARSEARLRRMAATPELGQDLRSWRQLRPIMAKTLDLLGVGANIILFCIYVALGGLILNMTFLSLFDRRTEFGTMQALGMTPRQILTLIVAEAAWSSLLTGLIAIAIGLPAIYLLSRTGVNLSFMADRVSFVGTTLEPVIHPQISLLLVVKPLVAMGVSLLLFGIYPGLDVALMVPVQALASR